MITTTKLAPHVEIKEIENQQETRFISDVVSYKPLFANKGPCNTPTIVYNLNDFRKKFGDPDKRNYCDWHQIYNFFKYGTSSIIISRIVGQKSKNAIASAPNPSDPILIYNKDIFDQLEFDLGTKNNEAVIKVFAQTPGEWGNNIKVAIFTLQDWRKNVQITEFYKSKNVCGIFKQGQYCIAVFYANQLVEHFIVDYNDIEEINNTSEYIYLKERFLDYKIFDGNLYWIDGEEMIADGNLETHMRPIFYGPNILKLNGGFTDEPTPLDFENAFEELKNYPLELDFVLCDKKYPNAGISLAKSFNAIAVVQIPPEHNEIEFLNKLDKSYAKNTIVYTGLKKQHNNFSSKNDYFSILGDFLGLRTYLIDTYSRAVSHCKRIYSIVDIIDINKKYTNEEIDELYLNNINIIKRSDSNFIFNSENTLSSEKLTQRLCIIKIEKTLQKLAQYTVFEFNDEINRNNLRSLASRIGEEAQTKNYIEDYSIVCDASNQKNQDQINLDFYYKPKGIIETSVINLKLNIV